MIIDAHAHLGIDRAFDEVFTEAEQWVKIEQFNVNFTIIQPGTVHTLDEVKEQHTTIAALCQQHPDRFAGMANPNPHLNDADYEKEVRRCVEELGYVGIKIHPLAHGVNPTSRDGLKVFELARKLKVPVMIHTGTGMPFASPANAIAVARKFPDLPIVMAHCGMMIHSNEAYIALKNCDNLYGDLSWTMGPMIREWVHELGAHRFMFASDQANNCGLELTKIRNCGLTAEEQDWILSKSALSVFKLPISNEPSKNSLP